MIAACRYQDRNGAQCRYRAHHSGVFAKYPI